jgi:holliday junction DNA helicase RuvA
MIAFLRGVLVERTGGEVVVDVGGVGYRVTVAPTTNASLGELGAEVFVHIHHHFREDDQTLYGFVSREERVCFQALISAHGVGPALGLAILGVHDPGALAFVLATEDIAALCLVPGVGKKTAARLLVELKEKLQVSDGVAPTTAGRGSTSAPSALADVREALDGLGYGADEITAAMRELPHEGDSAILLKLALQRLAAGV